MTNLDSILKSRDITLSTKLHLVKAMVFPVVMYGCESWTIKKAEHQRIVAFELWCWKRLLSPLDCKEIQPVNPKGDQSWVFIGRTDAEVETNILATWCEELTLWKRPCCWPILKAGGEGDDRGWDGWMASPIQWTWVWASSGSWWCTAKLGMLQSIGSQRVGHSWTTEITDFSQDGVRWDWFLYPGNDQSLDTGGSFSKRCNPLKGLTSKACLPAAERIIPSFLKWNLGGILQYLPQHRSASWAKNGGEWVWRGMSNKQTLQNPTCESDPLSRNAWISCFKYTHCLSGKFDHVSQETVFN